MQSVREQIFSKSSLLLGMSMLLMGNSLQGTLIAIRAAGEQFSDSSIEIMTSGYFLGFVLGTLVTTYLIERAGHIRGFTALASLASAEALGHIIIVDPIAWIVFRAISEFCFAGIYIVIESWLNERATKKTRGQVMAAYMFVNLMPLTAEQFLVSAADPLGYVLFCVYPGLDFHHSLFHHPHRSNNPTKATTASDPTIIFDFPARLYWLPLLWSGARRILGIGTGLRRACWTRRQRDHIVHGPLHSRRRPDAVAYRFAFR
jgi:MFS family permease